MTEKLERQATEPSGMEFGLTQLKRLGRLRASGLIWVLLIMCVVAALISEAFLNPFNIINVLRQIALFGIVSVGMTFVILTAGIDLSVGSIVAVVAVTAAMLLDSGFPIPLVILAGLVIGSLMGAANGAGITLGGIPPFIMTLGTMVMGRGLAMTISDGHPIHFRAVADEFAWLGQGHLLGLPVPVWVFAGVAMLAAGLLRFTALRPQRLCGRQQSGSRAPRRHRCQTHGLCGLSHQRLSVRADGAHLHFTAHRR